ncbi:acylphosphatase [Tropicimonas sp. IMCC34043]|uniref:acylphosphatase n=1 Tax=Tropicimonas sp. IMCC34043 TaxID=2248760 RepID=UPI000E267ED0|nr:acylphosphatase [Tropicimonas sp. IMCC34043]
MTKRVAIRASVTGRVQGVGFRAWTCAEAQARGLDGWVRNEGDGSVAAVIAGPADRVAGMVRALWSGPPAARVDAVQTDPLSEDVAAGFRISR